MSWEAKSRESSFHGRRPSPHFTPMLVGKQDRASNSQIKQGGTATNSRPCKEYLTYPYETTSYW